MKSLLLTAAGLALGATATVDAQSYVPPVGTVAPGNPAQNPDFRTLPVVETGLPSFNLPGMTTTTADAPTGSMVEGFATDGSSSYSKGTYPSGTYSSGETQETIYNSADRANQPSSESDGGGNEWIDRDSDGYTPIVDEVEQGVETAAKATGQAAEEVGEEVGELFGTPDPDDVGERDREGNFITRGVKSAARNTKKVARGTVKTTGKAVRGTAKTTKRVATKPFRGNDDADMNDADMNDADYDGDDAQMMDEDSAMPGQPSMGNGGDDDPRR